MMREAAWQTQRGTGCAGPSAWRLRQMRLRAVSGTATLAFAGVLALAAVVTALTAALAFTVVLAFTTVFAGVVECRLCQLHSGSAHILLGRSLGCIGGSCAGSAEKSGNRSCKNKGFHRFGHQSSPLGWLCRSPRPN